MKTYLSIFLLFITSISSFSQTITNSSTATIPCCNFSDSIDYNLDGSFDIQIKSLNGIDNFAYFTHVLSNMEVASPIDSGQVFTTYFSADLMLTATTFVCNDWFPFWVPGSGIKYVGFRDLSIPNNITYGWLKIDFLGQQNSCADTMIIKNITYNTVPNTPLFAGETVLPNSVKNQVDISKLITTFPNPANTNFTIFNKVNTELTITLINISGNKMLQTITVLPQQNKVINTSSLANGIYFLRVSNKEIQSYQKIIISN